MTNENNMNKSNDATIENEHFFSHPTIRNNSVFDLIEAWAVYASELTGAPTFGYRLAMQNEARSVFGLTPLSVYLRPKALREPAFAERHGCASGALAPCVLHFIDAHLLSAKVAS